MRVGPASGGGRLISMGERRVRKAGRQVEPADPEMLKFLDLLRVECRSNETIKGYVRTLVRFEAYLMAYAAPPFAWKEMYAIKNAIGEVLYSGPLPASIILRFLDERYQGRDAHYQLRRFFRYLAASRGLPDMSRALVYKPKPQYRRNMRGLTLEECDRLEAAAANGRFPMRDGAMIKVLKTTGIRPGEVRRLRLADDRQAIWVRGKCGERRVVVDVETWDVIHKYLQQVPGERDAAFLNDLGEPYSAGTFNAWFVRLARRAGIDRDVKPYEMRHTVANALWDAGVSDAEIAAYLGCSVKVLHKHYLNQRDEAPDLDGLVTQALRRSVKALNGRRSGRVAAL